jgi:hypothetical protein
LVAGVDPVHLDLPAVHQVIVVLLAELLKPIQSDIFGATFFVEVKNVD